MFEKEGGQKCLREFSRLLNGMQEGHMQEETDHGRHGKGPEDTKFLVDEKICDIGGGEGKREKRTAWNEKGYELMEKNLAEYVLVRPLGSTHPW